MGRFIIQALLGLLALNQTLCTALKYQHPSKPEPHVAVVQNISLETTTDKYNTSHQDSHTPLAKRAPPPPQMNNLGGAWGSTYVDATIEPPNSGWTRSDIARLAKAGYEQVRVATGQANTMVAALYVPGTGVYLGSIPHDGGQDAFAQNAPSNAPRLWSLIKTRKFSEDATGNESKYHAEDMAMFWYEDRQQPQVIQGDYPEFSYISVYGKKPNNDKAEFQDPCSGPRARIRPDCLRVLRDLDIAV
jgi:hypothetical protein